MATPSGKFTVGYTDIEFVAPGYTPSDKGSIDPDKVKTLWHSSTLASQT